MVVKLPDDLTEKFRRFPEIHMGIWRLTVELADGRRYPGVEVGWPGEIIRVAGYASVPFSTEDVRDVHDGFDGDL